MHVIFKSKILLGTGLLIAFCMLMPFGQQGVQKVEAQTVTVVSDVSTTGLTNLVKNTLSEISTAATALGMDSLVLKEFTLDGIARNLAQTALNQVTADMIEWINNGFNGSPAFVTNLGEFLLNIADRTAGEFIYGPELDRLCEPIRFEVRAALDTQYKEEGRGVYTPQCTLEAIPGVDINAFMEGDFTQGGWKAFFELGIGGNNDPIKAYYDGRIALNNRIEEEKDLQEQELEWSDGFLSPQTCELIESATGFSRERCQTTTPGAIIRDTLAFHVGEVPALRLLEIDEVNEVLSALATNLTSQAIQGTYGLLGLGGSSQFSDNRFGDGTQSYTEALASEQFQLDSSVTENPFTGPLEAEEEYGEMQIEIIAAIENLNDQIAEGEAAHPGCFDLELTNALESELENAELNLEVSEIVFNALTQLETQFETAISGEEQNALYEQYLELEAADLLRTEHDNAQLQIEFIDMELMPQVAQFQSAIDAEVQRCD